MDSELPNITTRPLVTQITDRPGMKYYFFQKFRLQVVHSNSAHLGCQHCVGSPVPQVFKFAVHMLLLKNLNPGSNRIWRARSPPPRKSYNHLENSKQSIFYVEKELMYDFFVILSNLNFFFRKNEKRMIRRLEVADGNKFYNFFLFSSNQYQPGQSSLYTWKWILVQIFLVQHCDFYRMPDEHF